MRTPSAVVSRTIASATARASSGRANADSTTPGRPFFICTGVVQTSRAPAAKARAAAALGRPVKSVWAAALAAAETGA